MSDHETPPPLDEATRAFFARAARAGAGAPPGAKERVLAHVESTLGPPGGGPGGSPAVPSSLAPLRTAWLHRAWPLAASFLLGGVVGAIAMRERPPVTVERIVYVERPAQLTTPSRADPPQVTPTGSDPVPPAPPPPAPSPPPVIAATPPAASASASATADLAEERKLLDVARHALDAEDGEAALAAVNLHERRFPNGVLVQEREAMAIRALVLLDRTGDARARAARFRARFPTSVLLPAIDSTLGPPSP